MPQHWGLFCSVHAQRGHSAHAAPLIALFIPGTPLQTVPLTEAYMMHSKQHRGCRVQDPGTHGYRRWKTANFSHSARCSPIISCCHFVGLSLCGVLLKVLRAEGCSPFGTPKRVRPAWSGSVRGLPIAAQWIGLWGGTGSTESCERRVPVVCTLRRGK